MFPSPRDEGRHPPGTEPGWEESWQFDAATADGSLGVSVRLALRGDEAWYWAHVAGTGRDLVAVRDHDVPPPRGAALELRGSGLWAELTCETPLDHWSAGLEAFGVALDDPAEAYGGERGHPMAVGLDLEWEAAGDCWSVPGTAGYLQPCMVHGEVLVGAERIELDADGGRTHFWGVRDWWGAPWWQAHGRLDDGRAFWALGATGSPEPVGAWFAAGGAEPLGASAALETQDGNGALPARGALTVGDTTLDLTVAGHAPVLVPSADGRTSRLWRALVRFAAADGGAGAGWCERLAMRD